MQAVLDQNRIAEAYITRTNGAFGSKIGIIGKIFGCWHKQISRPFTSRNASYRACLKCGARKHFDAKSLRTSGPFHYPPDVSYHEN